MERVGVWNLTGRRVVDLVQLQETVEEQDAEQDRNEADPARGLRLRGFGLVPAALRVSHDVHSTGEGC